MGLQIGQAAALVMQHHVNNHTAKVNSLLEQLASGYKINRSGDDPTGMMQVNRLETQIRGMNKAYENVQKGISMLNTTEDGLNAILTELQAFRETALEAAADGISDYSPYENAADNHRNAIDLIADVTKFNGLSLLDGSVNTMNIQAGPNSGASNVINLASAYGLDFHSVGELTINGANLSDQANALYSVDQIDFAIEFVTDHLAVVGSLQGILARHADYLDAQKVNYQSAQAKIRDVDTAAVTADLSKYQSLQSAASTSLVNVLSQGSLLSLLYS